MLDPTDNAELPPIPAKRYFTISEVAKLCAIKPHILRYWEQQFPQLNPIKRRGNRRYYRHHELALIRQIRQLLYVEGFTISGARNRLAIDTPTEKERQRSEAIRSLIGDLEDLLTSFEHG